MPSVTICIIIKKEKSISHECYGWLQDAVSTPRWRANTSSATFSMYWRDSQTLPSSHRQRQECSRNGCRTQIRTGPKREPYPGWMLSNHALLLHYVNQNVHVSIQRFVDTHGLTADQRWYCYVTSSSRLGLNRLRIILSTWATGTNLIFSQKLLVSLNLKWMYESLLSFRFEEKIKKESFSHLVLLEWMNEWKFTVLRPGKPAGGQHFLVFLYQNKSSE